jgi:hypothetical protein
MKTDPGQHSIYAREVYNGRISNKTGMLLIYLDEGEFEGRKHAMQS